LVANQTLVLLPGGVPSGSSLAQATLFPPKESAMVTLMLVVVMVVVAGMFVKTRRQRKAKQTPYVPN
jgi:hypothetical protein